MEKVKVKDFPTDINPPFVLQSYWVTTATFSVAKNSVKNFLSWKIYHTTASEGNI